MSTEAPTKIRVAHSPDSDDAFMFYALAKDQIDTEGLTFEHVLQDIETLNRKALDTAEFEVTAVSIHAYAYLADKYALLSSGASMGEGYGPRLVAKKPFDPATELAGKTIAIPGKMTSAYLAMKLYQPDFVAQVVDFDKVMDTVESGQADAGLIIHEGQLTFADRGFELLLDLGEWWGGETGGLPLPLGGNAIRRDLGEERMEQVGRLLRESIQFALDHREGALDHALAYGRGLDRGQADEFVGMYVNQRTIDYGDDGREAVRLFLKRGHEAGLIPHAVDVQFVG
ncbi:MAG: MqnA/MqnD/SBP family protein [Planctomycetota bacterium]